VKIESKGLLNPGITCCINWFFTEDSLVGYKQHLIQKKQYSRWAQDIIGVDEMLKSQSQHNRENSGVLDMATASTYLLTRNRADGIH